MKRTQTRPFSPFFVRSSPDYTVELAASRRSRLTVMGSGWLLLLAGLAAALHLDAPPLVRFALASAWLVEAGRSLLTHGRAYRRFRRFSLDLNGVGVAIGPYRASRIQLMPGSLLLQHAAWLRFETDDRHRYGELVLAAETCEEDWRCLNVLWRNGSLCAERKLSD